MKKVVLVLMISPMLFGYSIQNGRRVIEERAAKRAEIVNGRRIVNPRLDQCLSGARVTTKDASSQTELPFYSYRYEPYGYQRIQWYGRPAIAPCFLCIERRKRP